MNLTVEGDQACQSGVQQSVKQMAFTCITQEPLVYDEIQSVHGWQSGSLTSIGASKVILLPGCTLEIASAADQALNIG